MKIKILTPFRYEAQSYPDAFMYYLDFSFGYYQQRLKNKTIHKLTILGFGIKLELSHE